MKLQPRNKAVAIAITRPSLINNGPDTLKHGWEEAHREIEKQYPGHVVRDISIVPDEDSYKFTFHLATIEDVDGVIEVEMDEDDEVRVIDKWRGSGSLESIPAEVEMVLERLDQRRCHLGIKMRETDMTEYQVLYHYGHPATWKILDSVRLESLVPNPTDYRFVKGKGKGNGWHIRRVGTDKPMCNQHNFQERQATQLPKELKRVCQICRSRAKELWEDEQ